MKESLMGVPSNWLEQLNLESEGSQFSRDLKTIRPTI